MSALIAGILNLWPKRWIVTALVILFIFYLTLVPRPLPDNDIDIPGIDKVVHAVMFGALAFAGCIDLAQRKRGQFYMPGRRGIFGVIVSVAIFGGVIEILQQAMNAGRSGDILDFVADVAGIVACTWLATRVLDIWNKTKS